MKTRCASYVQIVIIICKSYHLCYNMCSQTITICAILHIYISKCLVVISKCLVAVSMWLVVISKCPGWVLGQLGWVVFNWWVGCSLFEVGLSWLQCIWTDTLSWSWSWLGCDKILSWCWLCCDKISSWGSLGCDKILSWAVTNYLVYLILFFTLSLP